MAKNIGVLLAGCGVYDGAEIHEATLTLYFLDREGVNIINIAPDIDLMHVINHATSNVSEEKRNVLAEAARIARGDIKDLTNITANDLDALIIPGGFGAAKNFINYAVHGRDCKINSEVKRLINEMVDAGKPVGAMCIAPMVVAVALREKDIKPVLTIGNDKQTASDLVFFGAMHQIAKVDELAVDDKNKMVSTPAYMIGPNISDIAKGIEKLVKKIISLA